MTQLESARKGDITPQMAEVAEDEGLAPEDIRELVASGEVVIPHNIHHEFRAIGIGKRLRTKVNANIGASNFHQLVEEEVEKLYTAVRYGADSVMDLSTGTDLDKIRAEILSRCPVMLGTVPIYQVASERSIMDLEARVFPRGDRAPGAPGRRLHDAALRGNARERQPAARPSADRGNRLARRCAAGGLDRADRQRKSALRALRRSLRNPARARRDDLARRRAAARRDRRRDRSRAARRVADPGRTDRARPGAGRAGDDRGAGPRAARSDRGQRASSKSGSAAARLSTCSDR